MTKINCCLCSRRTNTSKDRARIGTASVWSVFLIYAEKNGLDVSKYSQDEHICMKCHANLSHLRMKDRGPNKSGTVVKNCRFDPIIKKDVLRGFSSTISKPIVEVLPGEYTHFVIDSMLEMFTPFYMNRP